MDLTYRSTRGDRTAYTASQAVLKGLASDGGLFVPDQLPRLDKSLEELQGLSYQELAYEVMKLFLTDYTEEELKACIAGAYDEKFDTPQIAPLVEKHGAFYLELFHGATIAFKDMALSILPHLMVTAAKKNHAEHEIVILTATSGAVSYTHLDVYKRQIMPVLVLIFVFCRADPAFEPVEYLAGAQVQFPEHYRN